MLRSFARGQRCRRLERKPRHVDLRAYISARLSAVTAYNDHIVSIIASFDFKVFRNFDRAAESVRFIVIPIGVSRNFAGVYGDARPAPSRVTAYYIAPVIIRNIGIDLTTIDHYGGIYASYSFGVAETCVNITHSGMSVNFTGVDDESAVMLTTDTDIVTTCLTGDFTTVDGQRRAVGVDTGVAWVPAGIGSFTGRAVTVKFAHLGAGGLSVDGKRRAAFDFNTVSIYGKSYAVFYDKTNVADNIDERLKIAARIHRFRERLIAFHHVPTRKALGTPSPLCGKRLIRRTLCRSEFAGRFIIFKIRNGRRVDDFYSICRFLVVGRTCRAVGRSRRDGRRTCTHGLHVTVCIHRGDACIT